jgi:hypothetical protein
MVGMAFETAFQGIDAQSAGCPRARFNQLSEIAIGKRAYAAGPKTFSLTVWVMETT